MSIPPSLLPGLSAATSLLQESPADTAAIDEALAHLLSVRSHPDLEDADLEFQALLMSLVASAYEMRYAVTGEVDDLGGQIEYLERELDLIPEGTAAAFEKVSQLAGRLLDREDRTGSATDLERALTMLRSVVWQVPQNDPGLPVTRINLASALHRRYGRIGDMGALDESITALREVLATLEARDPQTAVARALLGTALFDRYRRGGAAADLDESLRNLRLSVALASDGDPRLAGRLSNLAGALTRSYEDRARQEDLNEAIDLLERALQLASQARMPAILVNLGTSLKKRFALTGADGDLDRAIQYGRLAVDRVPEESQARLMVLGSLGDSWMQRYRLSQDTQDLTEAIEAWEELDEIRQEQMERASIGQALQIGMRWAWATRELIEAYLELGEYLPDADPVAVLQRVTELAEGSKAPTLTGLAARSALPAPASLDSALLLEEGALLDDIRRIDVAELATGGAPGREIAEIRDLGAAYISLDEYQSYPGWIGAVNQMLMTAEERIERRLSALDKLESVWAEMADGSDDVEEYLSLRKQGATEWRLVERLAAHLGPATALLTVVVTRRRTLLLVVRDGQAPALVESALDPAGWAELRQGLAAATVSEAGALSGDGWLAPLRSLLQEAASLVAGVERLAISPDGQANLVPWSLVTRAAGLETPDGAPMPVVVLPSLTLLPLLRVRARAVAGSTGGPALVAGNPAGDLDSAQAEATAVAGALDVDPLLGARATRLDVIARINDARVIHLAAHARFAAHSPLDSGIEFPDGVLTARDALALRLSADLLVLSGCRTGVSHGVSGEELANLGHAFMAAGARSLLVSLWEVDDETTALLMTAFYDARAAGFDKATSLVKAMDSVRLQPEFADPYFWGGFQLLGDWE